MDVKLECPVEAVQKEADGTWSVIPEGRVPAAYRGFDEIVFACHPDQAVGMLERGKSEKHTAKALEEQLRVARQFQYSMNQYLD